MKKFALLFIFTYSVLYSQNSGEHISGFNMVSFTYKHNKRWSAYLELQERSIEDFSKPDYYELKGGVGYNLNQANQIFVGFGKYGTYKESKIYQQEFRIWLQYIFSQNIDKLKIDHRIRLEKRFFYFPQSNASSNDERFRYRISATLPLNSEKVMAKTFFVNAFDEVFFAPENPNFKRNRVFAGFGYQFNSNVGTNIGYIWQREFSLSGNKNLHFLYFAINFMLDKSKRHESSHIPTVD